VNTLLREGILDRKQNRSAGGRGWVYWVADAKKAIERYPDLQRFLPDSLRAPK
jgi:hypothetical protein